MIFLNIFLVMKEDNNAIFYILNFSLIFSFLKGYAKKKIII